ncbi:MFS transporter [Roseomonas populi]|uniref:MFS transporter n=1 Tax=Roseomonas populi TaxID=3121582 RepID=A0ABT1X2Z6_9PROT|nr:MFS transporter [Roseomonas pecuniae]MCR0982478.1 MFS transporter [Roseomonas pecuniae]
MSDAATTAPAQEPAPAAPASASPPAGPPPAPENISPPQLALYMLASLTFGLAQGMGNYLVSGNLQAVQATFGATTNEAVWLMAGYSSTSITASLLLWKLRTQFGLRRVAKIALVFLVVISLAHVVVSDLHSAVLLRAVAGFAGAILNTLAFLYVLEALPLRHKLTTGIALGLLGSQIAVPLSRLISPHLLEIGLWPQLNMVELVLSLMCLVWILVLPITPPVSAKVFDRVDAISLPLLIVGLGLIAVVLSLGRYYWWTEASWLGFCLAVGLVCLTLLVAIELNRERPLVNLHWLSSTDMIIFGGSMFFSRFILSEQTTGAIGFFQNLGLLNEHMAGMMWVIFFATLAGFLGVAPINKPENRAAIQGTGLALIAIGAWMESRGTSLTRPHDVLLSQGLVAFGGAIFLPPAVGWSFAHTLKWGIQHLTSFFAIFLASQNLGGLLGAAGLGSFLVIREKFHSSQIVENLTGADPLVVQRIQQYGASYGRVLGDPALRSAEGSTLLAQAATREAYVLAYNDLFLVVAIVSALCLLGLLSHLFILWLGRRRARTDAARTAQPA